jgi:hypothetical protein
MIMLVGKIYLVAVVVNWYELIFDFLFFFWFLIFSVFSLNCCGFRLPENVQNGVLSK